MDLRKARGELHSSDFQYQVRPRKLLNASFLRLYPDRELCSLKCVLAANRTITRGDKVVARALGRRLGANFSYGRGHSYYSPTANLINLESLYAEDFMIDNDSIGVEDYKNRWAQV